MPRSLYLLVHLPARIFQLGIIATGVVAAVVVVVVAAVVAVAVFVLLFLSW